MPLEANRFAQFGFLLLEFLREVGIFPHLMAKLVVSQVMGCSFCVVATKFLIRRNCDQVREEDSGGDDPGFLSTNS